MAKYDPIAPEGKRQGRRLVNGLSLSLCLCFFSACGYTLTHRLREPFTDPRGIFIRVFDNQTSEVGAEAAFTNALIRELQSRSQIALRGPGEGALELRGVVQSIDHTVTSKTDPGYLNELATFRQLPAEIGVRVKIGLSLFDPREKKTLWSQSFSVYQLVLAPISRAKERLAPSSIGPITHSILELRYQDMARDIMREVYDEMVELF